MLTRREWITGLGAGATLLTLGGCDFGAKESRFAYLSDLHSLPDWGCPEALALLSRQINQSKPDFILIGGDLVQGGFRSTVEVMEPRWEVFLKFRQSLNAPSFCAAGNHDLVHAQNPDFTTASADPRQSFREKLSLRQVYQSYDIAGQHVILLDSVQPIAGDKWGYEGRIPEEQMQWLRDDLKHVAPTTPIILVTHMPVFSSYFQATMGSTTAPPPSLILVNGMEVINLFAHHNLQAVLQGHLHVNETIHWNNLPYITGGSVCGKWWSGPQYGTPEGFGTVRLRPQQPVEWAYHSLGWKARRDPASKLT